MENIEQTSIFKFELNDDSKQHLSGIAQWAKVNAIVCFVSVGLSFLTVVLTSIKLIDAYNAGFAASSLIAQQIVIWIISLVLNIILYFAANNIQKALSNTDQHLFSHSLNQLARYFKLIGIILIVAISLVVLFFLAAMLYSAMRVR